MLQRARLRPSKAPHQALSVARRSCTYPLDRLADCRHTLLHRPAERAGVVGNCEPLEALAEPRFDVVSISSGCRGHTLRAAHRQRLVDQRLSLLAVTQRLRQIALA